MGVFFNGPSHGFELPTQTVTRVTPQFDEFESRNQQVFQYLDDWSEVDSKEIFLRLEQRQVLPYLDDLTVAAPNRLKVACRGFKVILDFL